MRERCLLILSLVALISVGRAAEEGNKPEALQDFRDAGFGLFIHWGPVAKIGKEISWPVKDASEAFRDRYFSLYKGFNPERFRPRRWAKLARKAGIRYVVFTAKHHAGFCMFASDYTDYDIKETPYGRDICLQLAEAVRAEGLKLGWYYSPADWHYQYANGFSGEYERGPAIKKFRIPHGRHQLPLLEYELAQIRELLMHYGPVDIMWYDGNPTGLKKPTWWIAPNAVIVRGVLPTPEQTIPDTPPEGAWETCMTMGNQWAYKPDDHYKSVTTIVHNLIKIRAKGGNYLLNVGPKADGSLPDAQVRILHELGRWMDRNAEAIHGTRPWKTSREGDIWFVSNKKKDTIYVMLLKWPDAPQVTMEALSGVSVERISMLGRSEALDWRQSEVGLTVDMPSQKPSKHAWVLRIGLGSNGRPDRKSQPEAPGRPKARSHEQSDNED